jgi:hypothetical protein
LRDLKEMSEVSNIYDELERLSHQLRKRGSFRRLLGPVVVLPTYNFISLKLLSSRGFLWRLSLVRL